MTYNPTDTNKEVKTQTIQACSSWELHCNALQHPQWSLSNLLDARRAMELANQQAPNTERPIPAPEMVICKVAKLSCRISNQPVSRW